LNDATSVFRGQLGQPGRQNASSEADVAGAAWRATSTGVMPAVALQVARHVAENAAFTALLAASGVNELRW
jgi:hypothetical protein